MESVKFSQELSSFLHSHRLRLLPEMKHRCCDVCREPIDCTFYRCDCCDFDVHPTCTRLPQQLRHVLDPDHKLTLHKLSSGRCSICKADCSSLWVYGCDPCQVNIHPLCIPKPCRSASGTRGMPWWTPPQQQQPHHFHAGYPTGGHPNFIGGGYNGGNYWYNHNTYYPPPPLPRPYNHYHYNANPGPNYGGHTPSASPSTITFGSLVGGAMFALVENLTSGAIMELVFGA